MERINLRFLHKWQQEKIKAWSWRLPIPNLTLSPQPNIPPPANPPRRHQPQFSDGSFHRRCIPANSHPASIRRLKVRLRHLWPGPPLRQVCHHRKDYGLETSVFDRHNVVNDRDLKLAAQRQLEYLASQPAGTKPGTLANFSHHKEKRATV